VFLRLGDDLTMDDIAAEAGVSKGTVYVTFSSREALISELTVEALREVTAAYREAASSEDPWEALVDITLSTKLGPSRAGPLLDPDGPDSLDRRALRDAQKAFGELLDVLKERGIVRRDVTTTQVATLFYGLFTVLKPDPERSTEEVRPLGAIILRGIKA
jgi:AcrR family transcriptional regulator